MIGTRILEIRQRIGWSQARLAKKLNVNIKTVKNWETDVSDPSVKHVVELAKLFAVTSDYLLGLDTHSTIRLDSLDKQDQLCLKAMCQIFISNANKK